MAEINELEDIVVPETPKLLDNEVNTIYVPVATNERPGIAIFPDKCFTIIDGRVYINAELINKVKPVIKDGFWYIDGENTGVSAIGVPGEKGDMYVLSDNDKNDIADLVYDILLKYDGGVIDGHYS